MTDAEIFRRFQQFLMQTESEHELGAPAFGTELNSVPAPLRAFYKQTNGASLFDGDLLFFAAGGPPDEDGTVQHASRLARVAESAGSRAVWPGHGRGSSGRVDGASGCGEVPIANCVDGPVVPASGACAAGNVV
jgi:hypothetical protein